MKIINLIKKIIYINDNQLYNNNRNPGNKINSDYLLNIITIKIQKIIIKKIEIIFY